MPKNLKVWDTFDCFSVLINNDAYGMSHNPLEPDGFNQYLGKIKLNEILGEPLPNLRTLPRQVLIAIINRLLED